MNDFCKCKTNSFDEVLLKNDIKMESGLMYLQHKDGKLTKILVKSSKFMSK